MSMTRREREISLHRRYGNRIATAPKRMGPGPGPRVIGGKGNPTNSKQSIKRLFSYLENDKPKLFLALLCVVLNTFGTLAGSYMLRPIINTYIVPTDGSAGSPAGLAKALVLMACIYGIGVAANYLQARIMLTIAQNALQRLRNDLFNKMQQLPIRFFDTNNNGDL
ncbi:MAG: ABC transporter transmembrane domain-containing protein, partial [bacterium]|nr:ABC transporter transmembrane domain-containing protein [bacterium]